MRVVEIDPADEESFDAWFAVMAITDKERWPGRPGWQRAERLAFALDHDGPQAHHCISAVDDTGAVVGIADLELQRLENPHLAEVDIRVLPEHRRRGIASAMVRFVKDYALALGRRQLGGHDEVPTRAGHDFATETFARHHGFVPAQSMLRRELTLPPDAARFADLGAEVDAKAIGYTMVTFADRWPERYLADRCELGRRMSTDIPTGDVTLDEEVWDEARVRKMEASFAAQDRAKITTAARCEATGHLVAFSDIAIPKGAPESVWQHDTLVMREHRGHGLGLATKLENVRALMAAFPQAQTISTWNAAENEHMIAINEAMGFEVTAHSTYWLTTLGGD